MLTVFVKDNCAYSAMMLKKLADLGISYDEKNIKDVEVVDALFRFGGKVQVPFIHDTKTDTDLYGSAEICDYLEAQYGASRSQ
jgi:glutaredoxin